MNTSQLPSRCVGMPAKLPHARIVMVYDSFGSAVRGKGFCDQLARELDVRSDLEESLWRSDLLSSAEIRHEAAKAALNADFVVLALSAEAELSAAFDRWFWQWMPHARSRDITLIVLFDPATARTLPMENIRCYLRKAAFAAGVHFFAHTFAQAGNGAHPPEEGAAPPDEPEIDAGKHVASILSSARSPRRPGATILVVDDNRSLCEMVAGQLHSAGYGILRAFDGEEAQRVVEAGETPIDLVVTDIEMPRLRGDEFAAWLQREHPEIGVLLMSSTRPKAAGTQDLPYLAKPFRPGELVEMVGNLVELVVRRSRAPSVSRGLDLFFKRRPSATSARAG